MKISTEAVLDHFATKWSAGTGMRSPLGGQLDRAQTAAIDSEGKRIALPGKSHVCLEGEMHVRDDCRPDPHAQTDRLHDDLIKSAERERCVRTFREQIFFHDVEAPALRNAAKLLGLSEGELAYGVIAEFQRWSGTVDGRGRLGSRAAKLEKDAIAFDRAQAWLDGIKPGRCDARLVYADALVTLDAWVQNFSRERKRSPNGKAKPDERTWHADHWMSLPDIAARTGIDKSVLSRQCVRGELPAEKRDGRRGPVWWINLSACASECEDPSTMHCSVAFLMRAIEASPKPN